jgi:hypothetical protein
MTLGTTITAVRGRQDGDISHGCGKADGLSFGVGCAWVASCRAVALENMAQTEPENLLYWS